MKKVLLIIIISIILTAPACKKTAVSSVTSSTIAENTNNSAMTEAFAKIESLSAEVKALKAAREDREAMVKRLLALNEQVRREREMAATNIINAPVTVNVTNSPPSVMVNTPVTVTVPSAPQAPNVEQKKGGAALMERSSKPKTRAPMYTITNQTSSVTVSGTNLVSATTNTVVKNYLYPPKRSFFGAIFGGRVEPIPTDMPSGQSFQQGYSAPQVAVVEQPPVYYSGYPYAYSYPYAYGYGGYGGGCRRLFGVRFHTR